MVRDLTDSDFYQLTGESNKINVVFFWAVWSIACTSIMRYFNRLEKKYGSRVVVGKVNVDHETKIVNDLDVQNIPTVLFIRKGKEIDRIPGTLTYKYLCQRLDRIMVSRGRKGKQNTKKS